MQSCKNCGLELPDDARFCGNCGHVVTAVIDMPTSGSEFLASSASSPNAQTAISNPFHPVRPNTGADQQILIGTVKHYWSPKDWQQDNNIAAGDQEDEERRRRALLLGMPLLGAVAGEGQATAANLPMVQGTPQAGGVPVVQGTPSIAAGQGAQAGGQALSQGAAGTTPGSAPAAGAAGPSMGQAHDLHHLHSSPTHPVHAAQHHPPSPHHPPAPHHPPSPHRGCLTNWLMIIAAALVIIAGIISGFLFLFPPGLSLVGSHDVSSGGTLHLHGSGFTPGSSISFTLDGHLLLFASQGTPDVASVPGTTLAAFHAQQSSSSTTIKAGVTGSFDVVIPVNPGWSHGQHTLRAIDSLTSRSAALSFIVVAATGKLSVSPAALDFGKLNKGSKTSLPITVSNGGQQPLNWSAGSGPAQWLTLDTASGQIQPGSSQIINATVDATSLAAGLYTASIQVNSDNGSQAIPVTLVVSAPPSAPAKLQVSPSSLSYSFSDLADTQAQAVTIANTGGSPLNWTAALGTSSSNDVTVALSAVSAANLAGGKSSTLNVTVSSPGIARSETITTSVIISATDPVSGNPVAGSPQTVPVTISIMFTAPPPPAQGTASLGTCSYASGSGWTCPLSLNANANNQVDWSWTAAGSGISGISINPSTGSLPAGQAVTASVSIPDGVCPARATITVSGGASKLSLPWSCAAPAWSASPTSVLDCSPTNSCVVTLTEDRNAQGQISWTASGASSTSPAGAPLQFSFRPATGILSPGKSVQVTITQTAAHVPCSQSATITFSGGSQDISVTWQSYGCIQ